VTILGVSDRLPLRLLDRALGEPVQHRLVRASYDEQPGWVRAALRTIAARHFRVTARVEGCLDLMAVCR
jgi:hypothetical protein